MIQTSMFDGVYTAQVDLLYKGAVISGFDVKRDKSEGKVDGHQDPIIIVKMEEIKQKIASNPSIPSLDTLSAGSVILRISLTCHKQSYRPCIFLTSLQSSESTIREISAGVPENFHINKHSSVIFIYSNTQQDL